MSDIQCILHRNPAGCYNSAAAPSVDAKDVLKDIQVLILILSNIKSMVWVSFNRIHPICQTASIYSTGIWQSATTRRPCHRSIYRMYWKISGYSYQLYLTLNQWYQWSSTWSIQYFGLPVYPPQESGGVLQLGGGAIGRCPECIERYPGTHINFIQH